MVDEIDVDGNGEVDFDEFVAVMGRRSNSQYTGEEVLKAFKTFATLQDYIGDDLAPTSDEAPTSQATEAWTGKPRNELNLDTLARHLAMYVDEKELEKAGKVTVSQLVQQLDSTGTGRFDYADYVRVMLDH